MIIRCLVSVAVILGLAAMAYSADEAPAGAPADPPAVADSSKAQAEFAQLAEQWKVMIGDLGAMQMKYKQAPAAERAQIEKQWEEMMVKANKMNADLRVAAEKAYAAAPNENKDVVDLLVKMAASAMKFDDYEQALEISKLLLDNKCAEKSLPNVAGVAAFCSGDFDAAEKYLAKARGQNALEMKGREYERMLPKYKELWAKEKAIREAEAKADDLPRVLMKTNKGDIEIELFENDAPNTVASFISLVEKGFYNGVVFHRVLPEFMAQGGDPTGTGGGGPGYKIACECYKPDYRHHFRGSLSMAHAGKDTGGSQFFLTFLPTTHLDGKHTVFGRVISGMDVLAKLQRRSPDDPNPPAADKIVEAKVVRKRNHEYKPETKPDR